MACGPESMLAHLVVFYESLAGCRGHVKVGPWLVSIPITGRLLDMGQ